MGVKRSDVGYLNLEIYDYILFVLVLLSTFPISHGYTNADDVQAMNMLYAALRYPPLPGWIPNGGDPCTENWQGVVCNVTDVISIILNAADLGGVLGDYLGTFHSIQTLDLSNNNIGGIIPSNLPLTIQSIFLADNNFTGSIPSTLSSLSLLKAVSLNGNLLAGEIPDTFEGLVNLVNLDFSSNNLSGELPPSLGTLPSLSTLHLQNNQLFGTLDVLQDLPLTVLDITNNLFSGTIPEKMLSIPTFSKDGNLFNTSISPLPSSPSPPTLTPTPPFFRAPQSRAPPSERTPPSKQASGPSSTSNESKKTSSFLTTKRVIWISIAAVLLFIILALAFVLFMPRWCRKRQVADRFTQRHETGGYKHSRENSGDNRPHVQSTNHLEKDPKEAVPVPKEGPKKETQKPSSIPKPREQDIKFLNTLSRQESHEIDMTLYPPPPPPPPPPISPTTKVIVRPIEAPKEAAVLTPSTSVRSYTIASLQQYTNSFSQDNLIGTGMLGSVYRAELPNGKLLAVKKLDSRTPHHQKDSEFIELVNSIDRIRHANVVELMGYCAEHGQRLLVYEYCSNGTIQDALHSDDEFRKQLSWNTRIQMALEAARALEYLHEISQPPVVHRNFKSANVLLDDEVAVRVSDCGMAPLISLGSVSQLSGQLQSAYGYGAPEFESGIYTIKSDVYSFGVVMLELLTGRKSHDKKRIRNEQFLVRWAIPQLHDIDALSRMVDPSLGGEYPAKSLSHFADIISRCVQNEPEFRPPMSEIVQDLLDMIRKEPRHQYQKSY